MPDVLVPDALARAVMAATSEAAQMAAARANDGFRRWEKAGGEPVCEIDLAVDRLLHERLSRILPDAGWLSEESVDDPARLSAERVWVVDPIDGTRDYLRGRPGWAVSVALVEGGRPVLGILDAPARGEVWVAAAGQGATRNGSPLHVAARDALRGARVPSDTLQKRDRGFLEPVFKPNSIALRIAMVAAGEADLLATLRWGNEWDIAAAVLVAAEAGASVSDALGLPLAFNTPGAEAFGVLVSSPGIHAQAVEHLKDYPQMADKLARRA